MEQVVRVVGRLRARQTFVLGGKVLRDHLVGHGVDAELLFDIYAGTIFYRMLVSGEPVTDELADRFVELFLDGRTPTSGPTGRCSPRGL